MGSEKKPLNVSQLGRIEKFARRTGVDSDTYKIFMVLRYTGMHISALLDKKYDLHENIDDKGRTYISWNRPKKSGATAYTSILKSSSIPFNVEEYAREIWKRRRRCTRQYAFYKMRDLGISAGIQDVSPHTFRHSLAVELLNKGLSAFKVCQIMNISRETLEKYGKFADEMKLDILESIGW